MIKKRTAAALIAAFIVSASGWAQVAGKATLGVAEMNAVVHGWSAKNAIMGKAVYNEAKQKVGRIDDIIISPENAVSFAILSVGGFVGVGKHDVAIPVSQLKSDGENFVLPGATKEALKRLPEFEYAKPR